MSNGAQSQIKTMDWLKEALNLVKGDPVTFIVAYLLTAIISGIPLVGIILAGPMWYGFFGICRKKVMGEKAEIGDVFKGVQEALVPALIVGIVCGLACGIAMCLCVIPFFVVAPIVMFSMLNLIDKKMEPMACIMASKDHVTKDLGGWVVYFLITMLCVAVPMIVLIVVGIVLAIVMASVSPGLAGLVAILFYVLAFVVALFTTPIAATSVTLAYRDTIGFGGAAPAAGQAAPPAAPPAAQ